MLKLLTVFGLIVVIVLIQIIAISALPLKSLRTQLNPDYLRAMAAYKRLEPILTPNELHALTTIGILNGAKKVEEDMEANLIKTIKDLLENTSVDDRNNIVPKIDKIEAQVSRDHQALEILSSAMDLAVGKMSTKDFRNEMEQTLMEIRKNKHEDVQTNATIEKLDDEAYNEFFGKKVGALRREIVSQIDIMKELIDKKVEKTLENIIDKADENGLIAEASERIVHKRKREVSQNFHVEEPAEIRMINSILNEADFRNNLIEEGLEKRKDNVENLDEFELLDTTKNVTENRDKSKNSAKGRKAVRNNIQDVIKAVVDGINTNGTAITSVGRPAKQETDSPELTDNPHGEENGKDGDNDIGNDIGNGNGAGGGGGGGGLVGIISSLSGGEGGSDIGALIGALTGVISTIFGPGGLDVESLISTGTSLIAGLLAGNKNFGAVLGNYVGLTLEGLSGGGGAINNGRFIGNFLGTVVAALSADPEEDDAPLQPLTFVENLISSFVDAKNRKASDEQSEERKEESESAHMPPKKHGSGSDSGAFVKGLVSHLVSSAISVLLNASLGVVSGASHASKSLFASSSHKSH